MTVKQDAIAEKLYRRAIDTAKEWFNLEESTSQEVFDDVFRSDADLDSERDVADKLYAVFDAVADQLEEDGVVEHSFDIEIVVAPSLDDVSYVVFFHRDTERVLYYFAGKFWHYWSSPEEMKEDLLDIYKTAKKKIQH